MALGSSDLRRSVEFYRDKLGLRLISEFPPDLAFFEFGNTRLLLERTESATPGSSTLYLLVDDIDQAYETLRGQGLVFESAPHLIHRDEAGAFGNAGEEEWMAFLRDPDGNSLALAARTPGKPAA